MADRGFTVCDRLHDIRVELNIPPFLDGQKQLPPSKVQEGRTIASVRIHVERAIGRIKTFKILRSPLPLSMARLANQIVIVCALLVNFQPVLIPKLTMEESDVDDYLDSYYESDNMMVTMKKVTLTDFINILM